MSRPARLAPVPPLEPREAMLSVGAFAGRLGVSCDQIARLIRAGLPAVDVSVPRPGRRRKRAWRIDPAAALTWLRERQ